MKDVSCYSKILSDWHSLVAPVGPPSSVVANNVTATSITLEWDPPFNPNDEIIGYGVTYQLAGTFFPIETPRPPVTVAIESTSAMYTLNSLLTNSVYKIVVFAVFEEGTGPVSEEITIATMVEGMNSAMLV